MPRASSWTRRHRGHLCQRQQLAIIRMQNLATEQLHLPWLHRRRDYPNAGPCDGAAPPSVAPRKAASTHYPHMAMIAMLLLFIVMIDLMNGRYNVLRCLLVVL